MGKSDIGGERMDSLQLGIAAFVIQRGTVPRRTTCRVFVSLCGVGQGAAVCMGHGAQEGADGKAGAGGLQI